MKKTNYRGSEKTREMIKNQLIERYGEDEANLYNPEENVRTYKSWKEEGFLVKKGEKALRSVTFVEVEDKSGNIINKYPKNVCLFYIKQVEKITK